MEKMALEPFCIPTAGQEYQLANSLDHDVNKQYTGCVHITFWGHDAVIFPKKEYDKLGELI
jgi:hypothetical protein